MSGFSKDPPRLKEKFDQSNLAERIAGQAFRDMVPAAPLSSTALARIAARVGEGASAVGPRRRLRWVFACCALLLGGATAASAQRLDLLPRWLTRTFASAPKQVSHQQYATTGSRQARAPRRAAEPSPAPVQMVGAPPKAEASPPTASREPPVIDLDRKKFVDPTVSGSREARRSVPKEERSSRTATSRMMGAPPAVVPAEPASTPSVESRPASAPVTVERSLHLALVEPMGDSPVLAKALPAAKPTVEATKPAMAAGAQQAAKYLGQAIRALRVEHSPKDALALLDQHSAELHPAFAHESLLLRVESMLALGLKSQVLWLLDGTSLSGEASSRPLLVTRGELRAAANRCSEAIGDFDRVLAADGQPSKAALLGRAICRKRLGDAAGAQLDMQRVRQEFPDDPAAEAAP